MPRCQPCAGGATASTNVAYRLASIRPRVSLCPTLDTSRDDASVTISCMVSDLVFQWHLASIDGGTKISVHVDGGRLA